MSPATYAGRPLERTSTRSRSSPSRGSAARARPPARTWPGLLELLDDPLHRSVLVQRPLQEPDVDRAAKPRQGGPDLLHHGGRAGSRPFLCRRLRRQPQLGRDLGNVLALIAVLGRLLAAGPRPQRRAEQLDLAAGVVEVVLAADGVAGEGEQPRQRVPVGGVAGGGHGQRPTGFAAHVLDQHPLRIRGGAGAIAGLLAQHPADHVRVPGGRHPQVDEAGARDVGGVDPGRSRAGAAMRAAMSRGADRSGLASVRATAVA